MPTGRLLVAGETALQKSETSETRNNFTTNYRNYHRQAGLGLGTYWLLGPDKTSYLAAIGGVGLASAEVYDPKVAKALLVPLFSSPEVGAQYRARYRRYYGQVYWAAQQEHISYGFSLRSTLVDYQELRRNQVPISASAHFFVEPSWFLRLGRGPIQGQATVGFSMAPGANYDSPDKANLTPVSMLVGAGVVVKPHLLFHRRTGGGIF